jgi:hypothetical protein
MQSAFGVDHGDLFSKYSMAYGNNRAAISDIAKDKKKRIKAMAKKRSGEIVAKPHEHVDSWFGVKKSYAKIAPRLMAAAAKGDAYAAQRLAAGAQGKKVAQHIQAAQAVPDTRGIGRFSGSGRARKGAQTQLYQAAAAEKRTGTASAQGAKKMVSERSAANVARPMGGVGATERAAKPEHSPLLSGKVMLGTLGAGAAATGGGALYANRKPRTA